jgi:uncharacterized surface protein with fasciclin (FAS1) repeats
MLSASKPAAPSANNGTAPASPAPAPPSSSSSSSPPAPAPAKASSATTGGSSAAGCSTPLQWLQNSGNHKKFLQLIDATPAAARLADILDSPDVALTLLAPTDDAIADSLSKQGLSFSDLVVSEERGCFFSGVFFVYFRHSLHKERRERERRESEREKKNSLTRPRPLFSFFKKPKNAPPPLEQANPALSLMVLQFHMLPNPIPTDQFVNGYSFNTVNS